MALSRLAVARDGNALSLTHAGGVVAVSVTEAEDWLTRPPNRNRTDAEIEQRIVDWIEARRGGMAETVAVKLHSRSPLDLSIWVGPPGSVPPDAWWVMVV